MQKNTIDRLQTARPLSVDFASNYQSESTSSVESSLTSSPTVERLSESPEPSVAYTTSTTIPRGRGILVTIPSARSSSVPPKTYSLSSPILERSSTQCLNVKFAPLPELAPRRRKSSAPLGVASRSQMMRRRRGIPDPQPPLPEPQDHRDSWTHQELESQLRDQVSTPPHDIEDPFYLLGKKIKGAWRRVNSKKNTEPLDSERDRRIILATIEPNESEAGEEGRVWEEEIGAEFPRGLGQTDTIMESEAEKFNWAAGNPPPDS